MYFILETSKSFEQVCEALEVQVSAHGFSLQHVHNIGQTLRTKGQNFEEECKVFEACNPQYAAAVLARDLKLNMALPCRISVYTDQGKVLVGMIEPMQILTMLSSDPELKVIAADVETTLKKIMESSV